MNQHLAATVPERAAVTIAGEEPEAGGDLGRVEQLPRQRHHAVDQIGLDQVLADFSLAGLVGGHGAVGEHEAGSPIGRQVVDDVLHPGEIGVS